MAWNAVDIQKAETLTLVADAGGEAITPAFQLGPYYDMSITFGTDAVPGVATFSILVSNDPDATLADALTHTAAIALTGWFNAETYKHRFLKYWVFCEGATEGDEIYIHLYRWRNG